MSTNLDLEFKIIVRGTVFLVTESDIELDSPNYFTSAFAKDGFQESKTRSITLNNYNPIIFQVLVDYLQGEKIFPLPEILAGTKSREVVMSSLKDYAEYFQLDKLLLKLRAEMTRLIEEKKRPLGEYYTFQSE